MMLSCVVFKVSVSRSPEDKEFFLTNAILDSVEVHIHSLGSFNFDGGFGEAGGGGFICLDLSKWLRVSKFLQSSSNRYGGLEVMKHSANFSFSR